MVVPPRHPKKIIFSIYQENPWLLGTTILGNPYIIYLIVVWCCVSWEVRFKTSSAMSWLSRHGGKVENPKGDLVAQLSSIGAGGKFPANAERDMHRSLCRSFRSVKAKISLKKVRLYNPSTCEVGWEDFPILLPADLVLHFGSAVKLLSENASLGGWLNMRLWLTGITLQKCALGFHHTHVLLGIVNQDWLLSTCMVMRSNVTKTVNAGSLVSRLLLLSWAGKMIPLWDTTPPRSGVNTTNAVTPTTMWWNM